MKYYKYINSKNEQCGYGIDLIVVDEYGSTDVQNIEVSEEEYNLYKLKQDKIMLNDELRDNALLGGVTYQNVLFDSDTDQKINLLATVNMMSDTDTITWFGMDNTALLCTKADLMAIGGLITELHSFCWQNNAYIKEQINQAETIEELEQIEINYVRGNT